MVSEAQKKATIKYIRENYDRLNIKVPKGKRKLYMAALKEKGISMNKYVYEKLEELL